jgi:hypothetical protein
LNRAHRIEFLVLLVICAAVPASANNPPQPDGLFSILLIFPLVILGARLAGVQPVQTPFWRKIFTVILLSAATVVCMAGTALALIPLMVIFGYGIWRAVRIMWFGQGRKRIFIGAALSVWVIFGVTDYIASLDYGSTEAPSEVGAIGDLRTLASAESEFLSDAEKKTPRSPAYGTMEDLRKARLIGDDFVAGQVRKGYVYGEFPDPARRGFLFYAVPAFAHKNDLSWLHILPGGSLLQKFFRPMESTGSGIRSFAVDETGVIRSAVRGSATVPVTQGEVVGWNTFS